MPLLAPLCAATLGCQWGFLQRAASSCRERILPTAEFTPPSLFPLLLLLKQDCACCTHCPPAVLDHVLRGMVGLRGLSLREGGAESSCSACFATEEKGLSCSTAELPVCGREREILLQAQRKMCSGQLAETGGVNPF